MNRFQVGDKVRCVDIPTTFRFQFEAHPILTVSHVDDNHALGFLEHNDFQGEWESTRFELVERAPQKAEANGLEVFEHETPFGIIRVVPNQCVRPQDMVFVDAKDPCSTTPKLVDDPNAAMIEADEDEEKEKQYVDAVKQRFCRGPKYVRQSPRLFVTTGEHLANAMEKTLNRAEHPQAMWSI